MFSTFSAAVLVLAGLAQAQNVLFTGSNYKATFYYDLDTATDVCAAKNGGPAASNWAVDTGINAGVTFCQGDNTAWTLDSLHSNRIVAMNYNMLSNDRAKWCGKEVQIFDSTGKQITIDEGPFVLMDACQACMTSDIIDVSAKAFAAIKGGNCAGNNPEGLTVKIIDNNVSPAGGSSSGSPPANNSPAPAASPAAVETPAAQPPAPSAETPVASPSASPSPSTYTVRGGNAWWSSTSVATESVALPTTSSIGNGVLVASPDAAPAPTAAGAAIPEVSKDVQIAQGETCQFGKWSCAGAAIQVCSYGANGLEWVTTGQCDNACTVSGSGSITCA